MIYCVYILSIFIPGERFRQFKYRIHAALPVGCIGPVRQVPEGQGEVHILLLHQAEMDSVVVSDEEVELSIDRRIDVFVQQIGSRQKLEQYYQKTILELFLFFHILIYAPQELLNFAL